MKSMAVEAVLQGKINDEDEDIISFRLLIPSRVIGFIIGKSGSIINEIRNRTRANIGISKSDKPRCADDDDELVEVSGEVGNLRDALVQIVLRLKEDCLKDKESGRNPSAGANSLHSAFSGISMPSVLSGVPSVTPMSYEPRVERGRRMGLVPSNNRNIYGYGSVSIGDNGYESISPYSSKLYGGLSSPSSLEMIVPAHAIGKVIGKGGANIESLRKISGASIEISESRSSRGDPVSLISGTSERKRAAENLIRAFIMST